MSFAAIRRRRSVTTASSGGGGGGGGAGSGWRSLLRPYPYTTPKFANGTTAIDAYGRGTVIDTTWNLTGQTGTVWTCTTQAQMTTAVASANPGDIVKIAANITAPSATWILGDRGAGTIYIVTDYEYNRVFGGGTAFERRPSVSDWSTLSLSQWAAEITACRARKADTYRILSGAVADVVGVTFSPGIFSLNASAPATRWVLGCIGMRPDPTNALTANDSGVMISIRDGVFASLATLAGNVWLSRCKIFAGQTQNFHQAIEGSGNNIAITDSVICELHSANYSENQCYNQSAGRGTKIVNCTFDGTGQHILFGGAPLNSSSIQTQDVEIRAMHFMTPNGMLPGDSLYATSAWAGTNYRQKIPWESKFSIRGWMEGCVIDGARPNSANFGYGMLLMSAPQFDGNDDQTNNWAMRQIRFRNVQGVINMGSSGYLTLAPGGNEANRTDFRRSTPASRLHFLDVLVTQSGGSFPIINHQDGYNNEIYGFTADGSWQKTLELSPKVVTAGTLTIRGLNAPYGTYGVSSSGGATGYQSFDTYRLGLVNWLNNALYGPSSHDATSLYTGSCPTALLTTRAGIGFVDPATDQWDIVGTYATESCNATLVRALTDAVVVETYAP